jgi:O-antigen/teichoic acid export membrane protein
MPRRKILKEGLIYAIQPFLERGVAFLLIPIYTAYLTPSSFGQWQFIYSLAFFVLPLMNAGIDTACWHFWRNQDKYSLETVFINACLAKMAVGIFVLLGIVLPTLLFITWEFTLEFFIYIVSTFLLSYFQIFQQYLRVKHLAGTYLVLALSYAAILGGLNIFGVTVLNLGFQGILFGNVMANILIFTVGVVLAARARAMAGRFDIKLIRAIITYGFPMIFGNLSYVFISQTDRFFLGKFSSTHELGLYSFGSQFAVLITAFIITPLFYWWNPILRWKIYLRSDGREIFSRLNRIIVVVLPLVTLLMIGGVVFVGKFLVRNEAYLDGFRITPLLAFGQAFFGLYCFNTIGLLFESRTRTIAGIVFLSAVANIGLNLLLVPRFAMYGAALASFFSFFLMYILSLYYSQRTYAIKRNIILEGGMAVISASIALGATYSFSQNWLSPHNIDIIFLAPGAFLTIVICVINKKNILLFASSVLAKR